MMKNTKKNIVKNYARTKGSVNLYFKKT